MSVSNDSTRDGGLKLIASLWSEIESTKAAIDRCSTQPSNHSQTVVMGPGRAKSIYDIMIIAAHRLAFLEMVTTGMTYQEMHDAQAYAKFVEKKRKLEDLDLNELRVLLR